MLWLGRGILRGLGRLVFWICVVVFVGSIEGLNRILRDVYNHRL